MYSVGLAYLLWLLSGFGALGFHRFYLGKIPSGVLWMCTGGLFGLGSIYDLITLPGQVRDANLRRSLFHTHYHTYTTADGQSWRTVNDGSVRIVPGKGGKEPVEQVILRLARQNRGVITPTEVALEANIPLEDAKKALETLVSQGFAELRVRKSGTLVYTLPEIMDSDSPLEDIF